MRRALAALFLLAACHTPDWRVTQIHEEIDAFNGPRRNAAVESALAANHATRDDAAPATVMFRTNLDECVDAEAVLETADRQVLHAQCNALRNALFTGGAVDATSADGSATFVLVAATPLAGDSSGGFALAKGANGEPLLVRPRMNVVHKRKIWREGTCNFMPSPVHVAPTARMFVIPNQRASEVRAVDVRYDGEDTEVVCDERVE